MELSNKKILLLGFGGEARAALTYIDKHFTNVTFTVADQSPQISFSSEEQSRISSTFLGEHWLSAPTEHDVIIRSPGVALTNIEALKKNNPAATLTSGTNLFLERHRHKTWAVTGTKGKSTTSSLLAALLRTCHENLAFGGNIGIPALSLIDEPADVFVLELSSYQLEDCQYSPHGAVFLNLFSEHLDHHLTHEAYGRAKASIAARQTSEDVLILPDNNSMLQGLTADGGGTRIFFGAPSSAAWIEDSWYRYRDHSGMVHQVCRTDQTRLKGPGNQQNILAVLAALSQFQAPLDRIRDIIIKFAPLPHRLEEVGVSHDICFVNDSISTVPEATINALETFGARVKTLILGGFDRGISFDNLATYLINSPVETVLLFPPSGSRIQDAITRAFAQGQRAIQVLDVKSMEQAVTIASEVTPAGHICLLSPASPSFPLFKNFEQRGNVFRQLVLDRMK